MAGTHGRVLGLVAIVIGMAACPLVFSNPMGARAGPGTPLGVLLGSLAVALAILSRLLARRAGSPRSGRGLGAVGCLFGAVNLAIGLSFLLQPSPFESTVIGDVRTVLAAQAAYAVRNGGFYDTLECLAGSQRCTSRKDGEQPARLDESLATLQPRFRYKRSFHPGPKAPPEQVRRARASASSIVSFAYVAVPESYGPGTRRAFCGDHTGVICVTSDGETPRVEDGRCVRPCRLLE